MSIEDEHRANKEFLEKHGLGIGSKIKFERHGEVIETTIDWVNPYYHWFGSDKEGWILRESVILEDEAL